jgi:SNF2 family DNA or RNA helicase
MLSQPQMVLHLRLSDGRYLSLPGVRLKPFIETLTQLFAGSHAKDGRMRFSALDAAQLSRLDDIVGTVWTGGDRMRALGRKLSETGRIPDVALPDGFKATLRPYQARGFAWLDFLRDAGLGGILADDMGLGKTLQALALIASEKAAGRLTSPALVIAPTSLMTNWQREAAKFTPDLKVLVLQGHDRKGRFDEIAAADIVLSTYPLVARDKNVLAAREWHILLLDEAQAIKNPNAATTRQIYDLKARHRFCLTGTPVENNLAELWSIFHFIAPGFLGDAKGFARDWRTPIEKKGDGARARMLAARVRPFLLRRTKDAVALDLPAKTEMVEAVMFEPAQQAIYDTIRLAMHERVREAMADKGLARSRIVLLDALLKLRQTCCDPRLLKGIKGADKAGSAKLDRLMEMVEELVAEGRKLLVFSQFTSMLDLIRPRLETAGIAYALLTGDTKDRASAVAAFQDGPAPVFLISLKAGGVGLNLTAADTVILYDPWWNPAVEAQAIDRAHRIGQDKPVFVFKLTVVGTIEEKIEVLKERKAMLAASLFDPDGPATLDITEADIEMLFGA